MKCLTKIAKEEISREFGDVSKKIHGLQNYILKKYGIEDPEIFERSNEEHSFAYCLAILHDTERTIHEIINIYKKK